MPKPMTRQRKRLFDFIVRYKAEHDGNSPTTREIVVAMGYYTTSAVHYQLEALQAMGLIELDSYAARSIRVVGAQWVPPSPAAPPLVSSQQRENSESSPFPAPDVPALTFFRVGPGAGDDPGNAAQ